MSSDLLSLLVTLSEKAANIARICRQDKHLLSLLVQEKTGKEKNPRFVQDFKTFADVLVQEVVKYYVLVNFPNLKGSILGEENNTFKRGDCCITVEVKETEEETEQLLQIVLQDSVTAQLLSREVHRQVSSTNYVGHQYTLPDDLAIWIDPIDSTAEYVHGNEDECSGEISSLGVQCVTVLIGAFDRATGCPVLGVINQPFFSKNESKWSGRCFYGVCWGNQSIVEPCVNVENNSKVVMVSSNEREDVKKCLIDGGYRVVEAAGAGNKGLAIVRGCAEAYIFSKGSTYPWDICAVHALLTAKGGGFVDFVHRKPILYSDKSTPNSGGLIAYRDPTTLDAISTLLDTLK